MSITVKIPNPSPSDLLDGNRKWATQLEERIPGFFGSSAWEQQPRVSHVIIFHAKWDEPRRYITSLKWNRFFGLDALIHVSLKRSWQTPSRDRSSLTETLLSKYILVHIPALYRRCAGYDDCTFPSFIPVHVLIFSPTHSQFQMDDVSIQATLQFVVGSIGVQHSRERPYFNDTMQSPVRTLARIADCWCNLW